MSNFFKSPNFFTLVFALTLFSVSTALAQTQTLNIDANDVPWTATSITKTTTNTIRICAGGQVALWGSSTPACDQSTPSGITRTVACTNCLMANENVGSLIGRIGNGPAFFIGERASITTTTTGIGSNTGTLFLAVNDSQGNYGDNIGWFVVSIDATANSCSNLSSCLLAQSIKQHDEVYDELENGEVESAKVIGFGNGSTKIYPNPAVNTVNVDVDIIADKSNATVKVYTLDGVLLSTLFNGELETGTHNFRYNLTQKESLSMVLVDITIDDVKKTERVVVASEAGSNHE